MSAELNAIQNSTILSLIEYAGPLDDPRIGWIGANPSSSELFKCERCGKENIDCSKIDHTNDCSAGKLLKELNKIKEFIRGGA